MPILSVEGMLDVVPSAGLVSPLGTPLLGTPYNIFGGTVANYSEVTAINDSNGWLNLTTGPVSSSSSLAQKYCAISRPLGGLINFTGQSFVYGGVRIKVGITGTTLPLVGVHDDRAGALPNAAASYQTLFSTADIPGGVVANTEYYFEWAVDMTARKFLRRLDGVRLPDVDFASSSWDTLITAQGLAIAYGFTYAVSLQYQVRPAYSVKDIYIGEKVSGEATDWLGPRSVVPIGIKTVTAPWTPSSGTMVDAFNSPIYDATSFTTPYVTTDSFGSEGQLTLNVPSISGVIDAVSITSVGRRQPGTVGSLGVSLVSGVDETPRVNKTFGTTTTFVPISLHPKAPGDVKWTKALLEGLVIKLKPVN